MPTNLSPSGEPCFKTAPILIGDDRLEARIAVKGAELVSLRHPDGAELIWSGDPAWWNGQAPNLFPIVGTLADDRLIHRGQAYPMARHGFLRESWPDLINTTETGVDFHFRDTEGSQALYPFAFELIVRFRVADGTLHQSFDLRNSGAEALPASIGAHPAFCWPLSPTAARQDHRIIFAEPEPAPIRRLDGTLLAQTRDPTPVQGRGLTLVDDLFTRDALIFDALVSRSLVFGTNDGPRIKVAFPDFPHLGIWTKPGAPFLCIEPWQGYSSPVGFAGEIMEKPGTVILSPGETRTWRLLIRPL